MSRQRSTWGLFYALLRYLGLSNTPAVKAVRVARILRRR